MNPIGIAVFILVQALTLALFVAGIATFVTLVKGCFLLRRIARVGRLDFGKVFLKSPMAPAVSTIATPPDASANSLQFIRRLLDLHFGRNEVVVVLDGPSEPELEVWKNELHLCPSTRGIDRKLPSAPVRAVYESRDPIRVVVIDKETGGTVDSWNAGVNASASPVIGILDPAAEFVPEVLLRLIQPMTDAGDEIIAVVGGVSAPPGDSRPAQFAALESLRAWLTRGAAYAGRDITLPFPGAALLVRRSSIISAGGFSGGPLELFLRMHGLALAARKPYRITFFPEPVSHSRTPRTMDELRVRTREEQQEIAHAFRNRVAIAGPFGWAALRGIFFVRFVRPLLEMTLYALTLIGLAAGWVDIFTALLVLLSTIGIGTLLSMAAVVLREVAEPNLPDERRMAAMFIAAIRENLWYRQVRNWWLISGFRVAAAPPEKQNRGSSAPDRPPAASAVSIKG